MQYPNPMILTTGSSPLARGLHGRTDRLGDPARIIPARAGFTTSGGVWAGRGWDHPRSRGVYPHVTAYGLRTGGSSPLARGLRPPVEPVQVGQGIIPARAGFTRPDSSSGPRCWDHPRSRGVYWRRLVRANFIAGSSPLARGLPPTAPSAAPCGWDNPRSRGVYHQGSSPLARGLPDDAPRWRDPGRIIPARAGFTPTPAPWASGAWDHPRSRGVYGERFDLRPHNQGSSPLARGLRGYKTNKTDVLGIIPARAGFTGAPSSGRRTASDHPRSRGVYGAVPTPGVLVEGSSPLARGLH